MFDHTFTDEELCAQALAADPEGTLDEDSQCFWDVAGSDHSNPLPEWYMPGISSGANRWSGWRRVAIRCNVGLIIAAFVTINAYGLCNTYGQLHF